MTREEIKDKVIEIVADKVFVSHSEINEKSRFKYDIGTDSLDDIEIMCEIEHEFGIEVSDEEAKDIATIGDAIDAVCRKLGVLEPSEIGTSKMTRAEQSAVERFPHGKYDGEQGDALRYACIAGYHKAEKETIGRAIKWLEDHADSYNGSESAFDHMEEEMITDFRKAMEEEQ